jgi:hypothetical protein
MLCCSAGNADSGCFVDDDDDDDDDNDDELSAESSVVKLPRMGDGSERVVAAGAAGLKVKTDADEKAVAAADGVDRLPRWWVGENTIADDDDGDGSDEEAPPAMLPLRIPPTCEDARESGE